MTIVADSSTRTFAIRTLHYSSNSTIPAYYYQCAPVAIQGTPDLVANFDLYNSGKISIEQVGVVVIHRSINVVMGQLVLHHHKIQPSISNIISPYMYGSNTPIFSISHHKITNITECFRNIYASISFSSLRTIISYHPLVSPYTFSSAQLVHLVPSLEIISLMPMG